MASPDGPSLSGSDASGSSSSSSARSGSTRDGNAPGGERSRWQRLREDRPGWLWAGALVVLAGLGVAAFLLLGGEEQAAQAAASGGGGPVDTMRAEGYVTRPTRLTDRIFTTGTLRANEGVELTSESSGKVERISFREGERVARGQLLVALNSEDLEAEREQLRHELRLARRRAAREKALLEKGGVSAQDYEETASRVSVLQARIGRVEAQIEKQRIRAPFSGTVGLRYVSPGSYLSPGQRIASLRDLTPIKIDLSVPARYAGRLRAGDPIRFSIEGSERIFQAQIYAIEPSVREETRAVQVRARMPNEERALRPGAFAEVEVIFEELEDALVVPSIAVLPERDRRRVFVAREGTAEARTVRTGIRSDSTVQILSGLDMQDTVLVSGLQTLSGGMPVLVDTLVGGARQSGVGGLKRPPESATQLPTGGG